MSDKQIGKGSKDACPSCGLSALIHSNHCPKRTELLEKAFKQWGALNKEIEELYYIVQTKPDWYRGTEGHKSWHYT